MTVLHSAALFSASEFIVTLKRDYEMGSPSGLERMREDCRKRASVLDAHRISLLEALRFGPDWFDDGEVLPNFWCLVRLVEQAEPVRNLSHSYQSGFFLIELVLKEAGWSRRKIDRLIRGRPLSSLYQEVQGLAGFNYFIGGWYDWRDCEVFLSEVSKIYHGADDLQKPVMRAASRFAEEQGLEFDFVFPAVFDDLRVMLTSAAGQQKDLFLCLD